MLRGIKMNAIILAAGNSTRFGSQKLLCDLAGQPMYLHTLERMHQLKKRGYLHHIILVTQEDIIKNLEDIYIRNEFEEDKDKRFKVEVVLNEKPQLGISHSIELGVQALSYSQNCIEPCMFSVCDQPYMQLETLIDFIEAYENSDKGIGVCGNKNHMGNPVIFHYKYFQELRDLQGDSGGKSIVKNHLEDSFVFDVEQIELKDIDTRKEINTISFKGKTIDYFR